MFCEGTIPLYFIPRLKEVNPRCYQLTIKVVSGGVSRWSAGASAEEIKECWQILTINLFLTNCEPLSNPHHHQYGHRHHPKRSEEDEKFMCLGTVHGLFSNLLDDERLARYGAPLVHPSARLHPRLVQ